MARTQAAGRYYNGCLNAATVALEDEVNNKFALAFMFLFLVTTLVLGTLVLTDRQDQKNNPTPVLLPTPPTQAATQVTVEPTPMIVPTPRVVLSPSPK